MKIVIRKAKPVDKDRIFELIDELENHTLNKEEFFSVYRQNIANPDVYYFVAVSGSDIIGFLSLTIQELLHHTGKAAEIQEFVVDPNKRDQGIGEELIGFAKEFAYREKCKVFEVSCNMKRELAHNFYEEKAKLQKTHYKFTQKL
jgi:PhnO protein